MDTSYLNALPFIIPAWSKVDFFLVGCGGTGSHVAYAIARLMYAIDQAFPDKKATATFIDPDIVEAKNIVRQLFCPGDLGRNKAQVLASRIGLSLGLEIAAYPQEFTAEILGEIEFNRLVIIIGCVDNAQGRKAISQSLIQTHYPKKVLWLDGGNHAQSGQVLLGNTPTWQELKSQKQKTDFCDLLPSPALIHPELLVEEKSEFKSLSCAELALANTQSLAINLRVAAEINDYLRGIIFGELRRYATYFDLPTGSSRSLYINPEKFHQ